MRTTVLLDDDTAAAIQRLRRDEGKGVSEAINELIRRGLKESPSRERFVQRTFELGLRINVSNVADAIETLEGPDAR